MNDPNEVTYDFVKGQGWVPRGYERIEVTFADGVKAVLIDRPPQKGELYLVDTNVYGYGCSLRNFKRKAGRKDFSSLKPRHIKTNPKHIYVTVQRV